MRIIDRHFCAREVSHRFHARTAQPGADRMTNERIETLVFRQHEKLRIAMPGRELAEVERQMEIEIVASVALDLDPFESIAELLRLSGEECCAEIDRRK